MSDPRVIEKSFGAGLALIVDGGILMSEPSTVVKLTDDVVELLREGKGALADRLCP